MDWRKTRFTKIRIGDKVKVIKKSMDGSSYEWNGNNKKHHIGYIGIVTDTFMSSMFKGKRWLRLNNNNSGIIEDLVEKVIK